MMQKKMTKNERGSALLLSLGILSLMLITGMAFLTNSLIARKNAFYNSSRNQAEFLGRMAINRAQGAVMLYQYQRRYNSSQDWLFTGFEEVVSHAAASGDAYVTVSKNGTEYSDPRNNPDVFQDGLLYTVAETPVAMENSVAGSMALPGSLNGSTYYQTLENGDALRKPQWVYVTNGATGNDRRIIGRYAFRVLPPMNRSQINLNAVLHKGSYDYLLNAMAGDTKLLAQSKNNDFTWLFNQNGAMSTLAGVTVDTANFKAVALTGSEATTLRGKRSEDLVKAANRYVGDFDVFARAWSLSDTQKLFLRKYFSDSPFPAHVEVYQYDGTLYHRFGLGQLKTSDSQILGKDLNSEAAVTALMTPAKVSETKSVEKDELATGKIYYTTKNGGIDFLNRICDEAGNFVDDGSSDENNLVLRRKQIAANLLDYCDSDDVPTSNKVASLWDVEASATYPKYTGNEKTAYLNEMGLFFATNAYLSGSDQLSGVSGTFPKSLSFNVDLRAFLEAVDVYNRRSVTPKLNYSGDLYMAGINAVPTSFQITFNYQVKVDATFNYVDNGLPVTGVVRSAVSPDVSADGVYSSTLTTQDAIKFNGILLQDSLNGYFSGVSAVKTPTVTGTSRQLADLFLAARQQLPLTATSIELKKYVVSITSQALTDAEWHPAAASLYDTNTTTKKYDFVRHQVNASTHKVSYSPSNVVKNSTIEIASQDAAAPTPVFVGVLGGIECRDPRQNLWLGSNGTGLDWMIKKDVKTNLNENEKNRLVQEINSFSSVISATGTVPSPFVFKTDNFNWLFGSLNHLTNANVSNPSAPIDADNTSAIAGTDRDAEVVTDPAYLGDAYNQHISTAYIRNAPMESAWELGAIHRGAPWQTINLKKAVGNQNTVYAEGDGAILDEIKIFDEVRSFGKLNLPEFAKECSDDSTNSLVLMTAWLGSLEPWKFWYDGTTVVDSTAPNRDAIATQLRIHFSEHPSVPPLERRSSALDDFLRLPTGCGTGTPLNSTNYPVLGTDAALEELAGRLIPMTEARPGLVTTFRVLVKAQTIKDIGNDDAPGSDKTVDRFKSDGTLLSPSPSVKFGRYDYSTENGVTLDEITGEVYLLATFDRNPVTGAMKLRSVRHINSADDANQ